MNGITTLFDSLSPITINFSHKETRSKTMKKGQRTQGQNKRTTDLSKYGENSIYTSSYKELGKRLPPLKAHYTDTDLHKMNTIAEKRPVNTFYPDKIVKRQRMYHKSYYKPKNSYKDRHPEQNITESKPSPRKNKIIETNKESAGNPSTETSEKTSWSNAVKKINYIKHYEQQLRNHLKRREQAFQKRQKSEFRFINTWLAKEPRGTERFYRPSEKSKSKVQSRQTKKNDSKTTNDKSPYIPKRKQTTKERQKMGDLRKNPATVQGLDKRETEEKPVKTSKTKKRSQSEQSTNKTTRNQKQKHGDGTKLTAQVSSSPKDQTIVNQINMADFANLDISGTRKSLDSCSTPETETKSPPRLRKERPITPKDEPRLQTPTKSEAQAICVAHNDALLANMSQTRRLLKKKDNNPPPVVERIPSKSLLMPNGGGASNTFTDMLITDAKSLSGNLSTPEPEKSLPRLGLRPALGSPIPMMHRSEARSPAGEITLLVPKLPHLNRKPSSSSLLLPPSPRLTATSTPAQSGDEEPIVVVTNERGVMNKTLDDGFESGYNSLTPRVSQDRLITPIRAPSSMYLGVPSFIGDRSGTPLSTITTSTMIDMNHSRPSSSYLDVPTFHGHLDSVDHSPKKFLNESRPPMARLPAINSRNGENDEEQRYQFTPIPLQSIRTSDGEMSD